MAAARAPVVLVGLLLAAAPLQLHAACLDGDGSEVAWWAAYKMPDGLGYAYRDANDYSQDALVPVSGQLDDEDSPLTATLDQGSYLIPMMAYNDEFPSGQKYGAGAHAKGVVAQTSSSKGFWLVHSVPKFPDLTSGDYWDSASTTYGQSFLCMTLGTSDLSRVGTQLRYMQVHVFNSTTGAAKIPTWADVLSSNWLDGTSEERLSVGGLTMASFAKSASWGENLYEDYVEQTLGIGAGFMWETWRRGGDLKSICPSSRADASYPVMDVLTLTCGPIDFKYTNDHSKWGVSLDSGKPYICIGGINRMTSQAKRGGGTVCFSSQALWAGYYKLVQSTSCSNVPPLGSLANVSLT